MTVLTGADLFTSYCMYSVVAFLHRRCSFLDILKTWFVSFFANLAGSLFFMAVLTGCMFILPAQFSEEGLIPCRWRYIRIRGIQG